MESADYQMGVFLLPIFGGWLKRRHQSSSLSRFGSDALFDVQILRHVSEYTAPLHFQERPVAEWLSKACAGHYSLVAMSKDYALVEDFIEDFSTAINIHNQAQHSIYVGLSFRKFIEPRSNQLWRAQFDGGDWVLSVCTLHGEPIASKPLSHIPGAIAYHRDSQHVIVQDGDLMVRTWPAWEHVASCESPRIVHRILPHPLTPGWIMLTKKNDEKYWTVECRSLTLDIQHSINLADVAKIFLYRERYILAIGDESVTFLTLDLRKVDKIPHSFPSVEDLDQVSGQTGTFYMAEDKEPLRMFDLVPRGIKE